MTLACLNSRAFFWCKYTRRSAVFDLWERKVVDLWPFGLFVPSLKRYMGLLAGPGPGQRLERGQSLAGREECFQVEYCKRFWHFFGHKGRENYSFFLKKRTFTDRVCKKTLMPSYLFTFACNPLFLSNWCFFLGISLTRYKISLKLNCSKHIFLYFFFSPKTPSHENQPKKSTEIMIAVNFLRPSVFFCETVSINCA